MRVLNIAGMAIIFALVRSTTSTASGHRWATKPLVTPSGHTRPVMRPNVHEATIHKPPHTGVTSTMLGQHSQPESTETMTDDHSEHHHQPLPVITQKPGPISETPLVSSEAASEEHIMPPVMTEDHALMLSEELTDAPESKEAMIEEISEHDEVISVHEFKEVLHDLIKDAVDKIVMKKAGIVGKLKTAKQNLIGHNGEESSRKGHANDACICDFNKFDRRGRGNCNTATLDFNGVKWCYLEHFSQCFDEKPSVQLPGLFWSHAACF